MTHIQFFEKGRLFSSSENSEISVLTGAVWITVEGDSQDHVVEAGQKFKAPGEALLVLEALENSSLIVSPQDFNRHESRDAQAAEKPFLATAP